MTSNANPSQRPDELGSLAGVLRGAFTKLMQSIDGMLPAEVLSVTDDRQYVSVRPCIHVETTDGALQPRGEIASVPVLWLGAGGFLISFPIQPGDLGRLFAADRDTSLYEQTGAPTGPNTYRLKDFSSSVFIPERARQWVLSGDDAAAAVWQNTDGTIKISLGAAKIVVMHPTAIEFQTPAVKMTGTLEVDGKSTLANVQVQETLEVDGDSTLSAVHIGGELQVDGSVTLADTEVAGTLTVNEEATLSGAKIGGVEFGTHKHAAVTPGTGTSGGPTS